MVSMIYLVVVGMFALSVLIAVKRKNDFKRIVEDLQIGQLKRSKS